MAPFQGFRSFSLQVMRAAHRARPTEELAGDLCRAVLQVARGDAAELWLEERQHVTRWVVGANSKEPARRKELDRGAFGELRAACGARSATLEECLEPPVSTLVLLERDGGRCPGDLRCWPLTMGAELLGFLLLYADRPGTFVDLNEQIVRSLTQTLTAALNYNRIHLAQRERVKELSCLYQLAQLATEEGADISGLLTQVAALLPPSWQYPDITAARIELDGETYETQPHLPGWDHQCADIVVAGVRRGQVQVAYTEPMPRLDEGPFLAEERRLIDTVAREVSTLIERKTAQRERMLLLEQLRHADRLATVGHLAAGVAHELNEPLGAILGFAQLARKTDGVSDTVARDLRKIETAALHAREVTARLMYIGRRNTPKRELLDVNAVIRDALAILGARITKHRIALACTMDPELPGLTANRAQLQQVVINLVVNAIHAMPDGGSLELETSAHANTLTLKVRDTGTGMSEIVLGRIFEPFFTTKQANEGTGLGLPVVRDIIESLDGHIEVESTVGIGSSFYVRLPLDTPSRGHRGG
jgi:two-component system NtrC family sensor kinase